MSESEKFSTENSQPAGALTLAISEILEACRRALSSIAEREGDAVRVTRDYYWSIPPEERYYVYKEPSNLTIGQLTEDLDNVRDVMQEDDFILARTLIWLGRILEALGEEIKP